MANYNSNKLRNYLIMYFKSYIINKLINNNKYEDYLVIHLRGGDALDKWTQDTWRPSPLPFEFYRDVIDKSGLKKILIVTTPPKNGILHPMIKPLQKNYDVQLQHGSIIEDFSILINCTNLVLDFSTFGYCAACMNTNLKMIFLNKYKDKNNIALLNDIESDVGFTIPKIKNCDVYIYDFPNTFIKNKL